MHRSHGAIDGAGRVRDDSDRLARSLSAAYVRFGEGALGSSSLNDDGIVRRCCWRGCLQVVSLLRRSVRPADSCRTGASCSCAFVQALGSASFILAAIYYWFPALIIGRGVFIIAAVPGHR